jgi:hypothetical protein
MQWGTTRTFSTRSRWFFFGSRYSLDISRWRSLGMRKLRRLRGRLVIAYHRWEETTTAGSLAKSYRTRDRLLYDEMRRVWTDDGLKPRRLRRVR